MATPIKIALAQINPTVGDITGNVAKMIDYAGRAASEGADLVVFPELAITGYPPMDLLLKESFVQANLDGLVKLAGAIPDIAIVVGYVDINKGAGRPLFNASALLRGGKIEARQFKTLLPTYDVFDEDRYFEPALEYSTFEVGGHSFAMSICEDIWSLESVNKRDLYHADPIAEIAKLNPQIILNISCSPFSIGKYRVREDLIRHHATTHRKPIIYLNQVGGNDQLVFDGRSVVIDAEGKVAARARAFEEDLLYLAVSESGLLSGSIADVVEEAPAETYQALVLGTRDYLAKCGFKKAVIGLSGGIDSAVTCAIACAAIGNENVMGIAMPSPYSSNHSVEDAQKLAENLSVDFKIIKIEEAMGAFDHMLAGPFKGLPGDVTEENIQARLRGTIMMAISNKLGCLVLTTGNKSELAVGYCTLYGDMCGGLAVISDLPKMQVYGLANYINTKAGSPLIPTSTIEKPPSAELRPGQTDQDSLPPYPVLDAIIQAYVELRLKPKEIMKLGFDPAVVADVLKRIDANEYKRKQAAPGLKVTATAFGVGWRMPIAQRFRENLTPENEAALQVLC